MGTNRHEQPTNAVKIGAVAEILGTSVPAVRRYEAEGLVIPFRAFTGTRWYAPEDIRWLQTIRGLLGEGLNFAGIRHLLAQIPCWALRPCTVEELERCPLQFAASAPCWSVPERVCPEELEDCYHCSAYRRAREFVNLKTSADIVPLDFQ